MVWAWTRFPRGFLVKLRQRLSSPELQTRHEAAQEKE